MIAEALKSTTTVINQKKLAFDPFMIKHRTDAQSSKKEATSKKNPCALKLPPTAFYVFIEVFTQSFKDNFPDNKSVAAVTKAGGDKWNSSSTLNLAVVAADNDQSESSTTTSPGSNSLSQSSGANSNDSADSLFTVRDPPEPDGVVEDQNDERPVIQPESAERVPIKEIMPDGTKNEVSEMNLKGCQGYYSFASKLRELYVGDDLTEAEGYDNIVHVLWPWHHYRTRYMVKDQHELDPRRIAWTKFSERIREIWVEKEPEGSSEYSVVENNQDAASQNAHMLRIIFREPVNVAGPDTVRDIDRSRADNLKSFIWIVHAFWAGWRMKEPLDPEMVTEFNMVLEQSNSLHPRCSVEFLDEKNQSIEIPPCFTLSRWDLLEAFESESCSGNEELGDNESGGEEHSDESREEDNEKDDKDAEVVDNEDVNDMQVRNLKRKMNERDEEVVNDEDVECSDEEDFPTWKNFLRRVTQVVIRKEGRVY